MQEREPPIYGNFHHYYGMRSARAARQAQGTQASATVWEPQPDGIDERIVAFLAWLQQNNALKPIRVETILDIGCNAAKPLLELCELLQPPPSYVLGVDIDPVLIDQARTSLRMAWSQRQPDASSSSSVAAMRYFPRILATKIGPLPLPPPHTPAFPLCMHFMAADWMQMPLKEGQYDLVLALSLNKWIHLHHGDGGLLRFLARIAISLSCHGVFLWEMQPWSSYDQARSLSRELRAKHAQLRVQPEDIPYILDILGLSVHTHIAQGMGHGMCIQFVPD